MYNHLLSFIIFLPILGALSILLIPYDDSASKKKYSLSLAMGFSLVTFLLSCLLAYHFDQNSTELQFVEKYDWISSLSVSYFIGIDGISVFFIPLTALIFLLCIFSSNVFQERMNGEKGYYAFLLFLEAGVLGTFSSQDLFLFFMFWTASLLPAFFLVGIWGGKEKESTSTTFFIYQLFGSALFLFSILAVYYLKEPHQLDLVELAGEKFSNLKFFFYGRELRLDNLIFITLLLGISVRIPIIPFHGWFPKLIAETPSAISPIISTVFLNTGCYALMKLNYKLFPGSVIYFSDLISIMGVVNIIYAGLCAINQKDIRKIIAYGCLSHVGFILLGLGTLNLMSIQGSVSSLVSQTFYSALLFFLIGIIGNRSGEYLTIDKAGKENFGALVFRAPILSGFFIIAIFSSIGVPGLGAFVTQLLVLLGSYPVHLPLAVLGLVGILISAGYLLQLYKNLFWGASGNSSEKISDIRFKEYFFLVPLALLCIMMGIYPSPVFKISQNSIQNFLQSITVGTTNTGAPSNDGT